MLDYQMLEVARLEQDLREQQLARAARYAERPVERHVSPSGRCSKRGLLVTVAGIAGAVAFLLASAQLPATIHAQDAAPLALVEPETCC